MFLLDTNSSKSLYWQLYEQIKDRINSGDLQANSKLPSVRHLSNLLGVSISTVENTYRQLLIEGYIESRPRSGYFVVPPYKEFTPKCSKQMSGGVNDQELRNENNIEYDFHPAKLGLEDFPYSIWSRLINITLKEQSQNLLSYNESMGEWSLRCELQKYLEKSRGVCCSPEQILICSGLQHSLSILALLLRQRFSACAVEEPGNIVPKSIFENYGFDLLPIQANEEGIDLTLLTAESKVVYITPSHQFPLGYVMPINKRLKLIEWAESVGGFIIEDDYDSELRYSGKPIPSLQGLNPSGNIVYLGTFSKVLSPSLRISYMVLCPSLIESYKQMFKQYHSSVSVLEQLTLQKFISHGFWDRHLRKFRTSYKKRHDAMIDAVNDVMGNAVEIIGQGAGLHIVVRVLQKDSESELIELAKQNGVRVYSVSEYYVTNSDLSPKIMLGFGGLNPESIYRGIRRLNSAWF
ncbi:PLP-dependent aminotransferase family protein [Desulfosporosinus sp. Sb-LF]|uniref:MocR-like pyridoxine biosynthesis transcription factor PdxR n=1 Tax=Desulfosporosinus sp. Sb-LF TaxID=2560027 RepID=UPI00107F04CE|nr:PLP-dependent aminotransferase family protein [Desulfosporosinus sp. Sb-LF]TGE34373.1 PLP-dependent aminotransferase family protein [Desulfosporosinus sp. Sb-LF]